MLRYGLLLLLALPLTATAQPASFPDATDALRFRNIGPAVTGGRIHDVEALPSDPSTVYVATASGGLWKSTNHGVTWTPIFEDQATSTFGDVAIAPSNPDILYAGTGEQQNRQSTSWGNGVYRSDDGGQTWRHLGLEATRHTGRVAVHPTNPDVAWVAAQGNLWADSPERGVYRTENGGRTWQKTLFVDAHTGATDLAVHPTNPDVIYAATYQRQRKVWGFNGGGPGSGLWRSTDGGRTWQSLTAGLPEGDKGRIGLAVSADRPDRVYAVIEHPSQSGIYRSDDRGQTWARVNTLNPRPMYYSHLIADPTDADRVYLLATEAYRSDDGGDTFLQLPTRPTYDVGVHSDHHTMWIDPNDPEHFYLGGDAGLHETWDLGLTYRRINNLPIGQFYAIGVDDRTPYNVYGGMQDNHSWMGPSATRRYIGIINDDWNQIGFGDGMYQQPDDEGYVYVDTQNGGIARVHPDTGDRQDVRPYPEDAADLRYDWATPTLVSQHDGATVYHGGNKLFISNDRGRSWRATGDLTRQEDREQLAIMGVRGEDIHISKNDGTSSYGEIVTISESPLDADVLWVGTDDGNVQVSRDGGATWTEVGANLPGPRTYVSRVAASGAAPGTAWVTLDAHRRGDLAPYVYRTTDWGRTWTAHTAGLPADGSVNVILEHPSAPHLLFLGTEHHLFASTNGGVQWARFMPNLPVTLYDDLKIQRRENDLVVGTHGRSIWVLDDVTPLAEWSQAIAEAEAHLFSIQPATMYHHWKATSYRGQEAYNGENDEVGALVTYHLGRPATAARLIVRNATGKTIRSLDAPTTAGMHRLRWDLRHTPPPTYAPPPPPRPGLVQPETILPALPRPNDTLGPFVAPGTYTVTLEAGGVSQTQPVTVHGDPLLDLTPADYAEREAFLIDLLALQNEAFAAAGRANTLRDAAAAHRDSLNQMEDLPGDRLVRAQAHADSVRAVAQRINRLRSQVYGLAGAFNTSGVTQPSLTPPTQTHRDRLRRLTAAFRLEAERLSTYEDTR